VNPKLVRVQYGDIAHINIVNQSSTEKQEVHLIIMHEVKYVL
jgi:hypothetical protein